MKIWFLFKFRFISILPREIIIYVLKLWIIFFIFRISTISIRILIGDCIKYKEIILSLVFLTKYYSGCIKIYAVDISAHSQPATGRIFSKSYRFTLFSEWNYFLLNDIFFWLISIYPWEVIIDIFSNFLGQSFNSCGCIVVFISSVKDKVYLFTIVRCFKIR